jgi:hypothetical protein
MSTTKDVTIEEGPDAGKTFIIKKMSLLAGDSWANRVALALCKSGVDISGLTTRDEDGKAVFRGMLDMVGIVPVALKALGGVEEDKALDLLAELINGVKIRLPNGSERPAILETDITSISTLWKIRIESLKVNLDFLTAGVTQ